MLLPKIQKPVKYRVILADPPWHFEVWGEGSQRNVQSKYRTQDTEWISRIPVQSVSADNCCLFLWATWPRLKDALMVIDAWGFEYKTVAFCWVKCCKNGNPGFGLGYWTRGNSEPCLLATRGKPKRLDKGVSEIIVSEFEPDDLLVAPRTKHSEKPAESHKRIERLVAGPYLELFGRKKVEGWTVIGDEITGRDIVDDIRLLS